MKYFYSIIFAVFMVVFCPIEIQSQSLMQTAKQAEQRARELKQQEDSRYDAILNSKNLSKYEQYITDYPRGKKTIEIKRRAEEIKLWNKAKQINTIPAYEEYLTKTQYHWYDSDAKSSIKNIKQRQEYDAWQKVVKINTTEAYKQYLANNPQSSYAEEANLAIKKIEATQAWDRIKYSEKISDYENFLVNYSNTNEASSAKIKLHELKGVKYYQDGYLESAYKEFSQISRSDVSYGNRHVFDKVIEYNEYSQLNAYSSESSLRNFMSKYPNSVYYNQVSNVLAIQLAKKLGSYATEYDYNRALGYATNATTRNTVETYISKNKEKKRAEKRAIKRAERYENGGSVNLGLNFMDMGIGTGDNSDLLFCYNVGLMLRFGNYKDILQFAVGLYPGVIYDGDCEETSFHMPVVSQLKLNIIRSSAYSRIFLMGQYQYNIVRDDYIEPDMSWCVGFGVGRKHFDWTLYFKNDFSSSYGCSNYYLGLSMIYYWQL